MRNLRHQVAEREAEIERLRLALQKIGGARFLAIGENPKTIAERALMPVEDAVKVVA